VNDKNRRLPGSNLTRASCITSSGRKRPSRTHRQAEGQAIIDEEKRRPVEIPRAIGVEGAPGCVAADINRSGWP
jgi:hypothetical protein